MIRDEKNTVLGGWKTKNTGEARYVALLQQKDNTILTFLDIAISYITWKVEDGTPRGSDHQLLDGRSLGCSPDSGRSTGYGWIYDILLWVGCAVQIGTRKVYHTVTAYRVSE